MPAPRSLGAYLERNRRRSPEGAAVRTGTRTGWTTTTWADLHDATLDVVAAAGGLPGRAPVLVVVDGTAHSVATVLGLAAAGVDVLLLEEQNSYLADREAVVHHIGASTVVGPGGATTRPPEPMEYLTYDELRGASARTEAPPGARGGEILQMTSGSTGEPRIARHPVDNILRGGLTYRGLCGVAEGDTVLAAVPLAHSFGLVGGLAAALVSGACLRTLKGFNPRRLLEGLDDAAVLLGTPLVYRLMAPLLRPGRHRTRLRAVLSSGGPMEPDLAARIAEGTGRPVRQVYGSTETGLIACQSASPGPREAGSVGPAAPGVQLRVEADRAAGEEDVGRLLVRTPTMFCGYLGSADPVRTEGGFYDTGDLARVDDTGHLFLAGRKDTFVNVGGRKVNPARIERIITEHPGVREVFVYGTNRPGGEEEINAAVVLRPGVGADEVVEFCRSRGLMPYEVPHRVHVMDGLPRGGMGKVDRRGVIAATASDGHPGRTTQRKRRLT